MRTNNQYTVLRPFGLETERVPGTRLFVVLGRQLSLFSEHFLNPWSTRPAFDAVACLAGIPVNPKRITGQMALHQTVFANAGNVPSLGTGRALRSGLNAI